MKRLVLITTIITIFFIVSTTSTFASVDGINSDNYLTYEKTYEDAYGYNKGECDKPYLEGEEYFYNEYYDHWNVDKIYDRNLLIEQGIIIEEENIIEEETTTVEEETTTVEEETTTVEEETIPTKEEQTVVVETTQPTKNKVTTTSNKKTSDKTLAKNWAKSHYNKPIKVVKTNKVPKKRKGTVYIEKVKTKSKGGYKGYTIKGKHSVKYPKKVKKGKKVTMYFIYNPYTNYCDDIVAVVCLGKVK